MALSTLKFGYNACMACTHICSLRWRHLPNGIRTLDSPGAIYRNARHSFSTFALFPTFVSPSLVGNTMLKCAFRAERARPAAAPCGNKYGAVASFSTHAAVYGYN